MSAYSAFATGIKLADRTLRALDIEPTPIAAADASRGEPLRQAPTQGVCAEGAKAQHIDTARDKLRSVSAGGGLRTYCLHVERAPGGAPDEAGRRYLGSFCAFDDAAPAADANKHLPWFSEEVLGTARPGKRRTKVQAECFAFEGENQEWRAVPRGLQASRGLANNVVAQHKDIASMQETQPLSLLLGGTLVDRLPVADQRVASSSDFFRASTEAAGKVAVDIFGAASPAISSHALASNRSVACNTPSRNRRSVGRSSRAAPTLA